MLILKWNDTSGQCGYVNGNNDTIIPFGKYAMCFTDTFKDFAIVFKNQTGFVGINRKEEVLFKVFPFDNGPDYPSEGYFRIINNENKLGYADINGQIKITPQFDCAHPFLNGKAKVSNQCEQIHEGEHSRWESEEWFTIDKAGNRL